MIDVQTSRAFLFCGENNDNDDDDVVVGGGGGE